VLFPLIVDRVTHTVAPLLNIARPKLPGLTEPAIVELRTAKFTVAPNEEGQTP
jgi:hypothetical protein